MENTILLRLLVILKKIVLLCFQILIPMKLYPLSFAPIFKERIWGGEKLQTELHKPIHQPLIGESWEVSTVKGDVSVISNGALKGTSLQALIEQTGKPVIGIMPYISDLGQTSRCLSSSSMPLKTFPYKYTPMTLWPKPAITPLERPRCGISWMLTLRPLSSLASTEM